MIEVFIEALASLTQYYDQPLRCFTFGDFQLVPIVEEFEEILEEESLYGIIGGYHKWLKARTQELDWLPKLKFSSEEEVETPEESEEVQALKVELERMQVIKEKLKTTTIKVRKECDELRDVNVATAEALEQETKRA